MLARDTDEDGAGIPWFLLPPYCTAQQAAIDEVRGRLRGLNRETRDQIVAGLSFGFWAGWLGPKYEEVWRRSLHHAFPNGTGKRKEVSALAEQIRKFRNRIAHHDSLLNVDVAFEMQAVFQLARIIDPQVAAWMKSVDRTRQVGAGKPVSMTNVVVVPAGDAWNFYLTDHAYVCQAGRYFQQTDHIAFYTDHAVQSEIPQIKKRLDNVMWNADEAARLSSSSEREDRRLGAVMQSALSAGWTHGIYQVFLLSSPGDPKHVTLDHPVPNSRRGKDSAFVRKQRYTSIHRLRHADDVWDL